MDAIERSIYLPDWLTLLFLFAFVLLVLLKAMNSDKLQAVLSSITNKGFLEIEIEENESPFTLFSGVFTLFCLLTISLLVYVSLVSLKDQQINLADFSQILLLLVVYMLSRFILEYLLIQLFRLKQQLAFFFLSKRNYLFSISIGMWGILGLFLYWNQSVNMLWIGVGVLVTVRLLAILANNKNLIFSHLFYFILYLCSFEIAPLLIMYKLITK